LLSLSALTPGRLAQWSPRRPVLPNRPVIPARTIALRPASTRRRRQISDAPRTVNARGRPRAAAT
jgi:hypothetical protein